MYEALELIGKKIALIEEIVNQYGGVTLALEDEKLARPALLMHLVAIAEQFGRLQNAMAFEILARFEKEDIRGAFVAHDYEGVNIALIEGVIREYLPRIKKVVETVLDDAADAQ
jgi:uncharacterized protein with HEPN domain